MTDRDDTAIDPETAIDAETEVDPETESDAATDVATEADTEAVPRRRLRVNPVALVIGLLYASLGAGTLADEAWGGVDLNAIAAIGAVTAGMAVIVALLRR